MIGMKVRTEPIRDKRTGRFVSIRAFKNVVHAAASISKDVKRTITRSQSASTAGQPPRTRRGRLRFAIRWFADKVRGWAVIGPRKSVVGEAGRAHEFGGRFKNEEFDERPFMGPALERAVPRFAGSFRGSIGE